MNTAVLQQGDKSRLVMWPKMPVELTTFQSLRKLYGPYVESHCELGTESIYWRAYRRKVD